MADVSWALMNLKARLGAEGILADGLWEGYQHDAEDSYDPRES